MGFRKLAVDFFSLRAAAFAQSDQGTFPDAISDPAGAVVGSAPIEATNVETGLVCQAARTSTGNYTIPQLPAGASPAECRQRHGGLAQPPDDRAGHVLSPSSGTTGVRTLRPWKRQSRHCWRSLLRSGH